MALAVLAGVVALLAFGGRSQGDRRSEGAAPAFTLASTAGGEVSLSDYRGQDVLLYFNEGIGCDACFSQMTELEAHGDHLRRERLTVLPIVVNGVDDAQQEVERFGLKTPFLSDPDKSVSNAYETLGTGHHADLPGHSFVLIDGDGEIKWRRDYPSMFVAPDDLLAQVAAARG